MFGGRAAAWGGQSRGLAVETRLFFSEKELVNPHGAGNGCRVGRSVRAGGRHWRIKADRINSLLGPGGKAQG